MIITNAIIFVVGNNKGGDCVKLKQLYVQLQASQIFYFCGLNC